MQGKWIIKLQPHNVYCNFTKRFSCCNVDSINWIGNQIIWVISSWKKWSEKWAMLRSTVILCWTQSEYIETKHTSHITFKPILWRFIRKLIGLYWRSNAIEYIAFFTRNAIHPKCFEVWAKMRPLQLHLSTLVFVSFSVEKIKKANGFYSVDDSMFMICSKMEYWENPKWTDYWWPFSFVLEVLVKKSICWLNFVFFFFSFAFQFSFPRWDLLRCFISQWWRKMVTMFRFHFWSQCQTQWFSFLLELQQ